MGKHNHHHMQLTSLYCYFPDYDESEFNEKFRNRTKQQIIRLLKEFKDGLTDREMAQYLGYKDLNIVRPRRNELANVKNYCPPIIEDSGRTKKINGKTCILWILSMENLNSYMRH